MAFNEIPIRPVTTKLCLKMFDKKNLCCDFSNPFLALEGEVANALSISTIQDGQYTQINPFYLSMIGKDIYTGYYFLRLLVK